MAGEVDLVDFYFFDRDEKMLFVRDDALEAIHQEKDYILNATFPSSSNKIENGQLIGFYDVDNKFILFEIVYAKEQLPDNEVTVTAYLAAISELRDEPIESISVSDKEAGIAVSNILINTRWSVGTVYDSEINSSYFYFTSVWEGLKTIVEAWGVKLSFEWYISETGIQSRTINVLQRLGADRGKRLEISKDIETVSLEYDDRELVTALYGRGKGEEVGEDEDGDATYGRRLTFENIVWETPGNPLNKPSGRKYLEDPTATALYGRNGRPRFGFIEFDDCEDAEELIQLTYEQLQELCAPKVSVSASIIDLEALWDYTYEAIRLGDDVTVIIEDGDKIDAEVKAEITDIKRNLLFPENTEVTIGNYQLDSVDMQVETNQALEKALSISQVAAAAVMAAPSLIQGFIDTVQTQIKSSGTNLYTDTDGAFVFESADGTKAVKIAGAGILLANSKIGGVWQWRTAINGEGVAADEIYTGTLRSAIIFAGTLQAVLGTFTGLTAGDDTAAHMRMGADEYGEPYFEVLGSDGTTEQLKITKKGTTYTGYGRIAKYAIGDRYGIGVYID